MNSMLMMNMTMRKEAFAFNHFTVFELVRPGTYVGMRSPTNAIESFFFIVEVQIKGLRKRT